MKICPFMSTADKKEPCTIKCALCTTSGVCNINNCAHILEELLRKIK